MVRMWSEVSMWFHEVFYVLSLSAKLSSKSTALFSKEGPKEDLPGDLTQLLLVQFAGGDALLLYRMFARIVKEKLSRSRKGNVQQTHCHCEVKRN